MGGMDPRDALAELRRGADIVVATPGLLQDFVKVFIALLPQALLVSSVRPPGP